MLGLYTYKALYVCLCTSLQNLSCIVCLQRGVFLLFLYAAYCRRMSKRLRSAASILGELIASMTACQGLSLAPLELISQVVLVGHWEGQDHKTDDQAAILFHHTPTASTGR